MQRRCIYVDVMLKRRHVPTGIRLSVKSPSLKTTESGFEPAILVCGRRVAYQLQAQLCHSPVRERERSSKKIRLFYFADALDDLCIFIGRTHHSVGVVLVRLYGLFE